MDQKVATYGPTAAPCKDLATKQFLRLPLRSSADKTSEANPIMALAVRHWSRGYRD